MSYIRSHGGEGILNDEDVEVLKAATKAIGRLMNDGRWYGYMAIRSASGGQRECLRRMRDLRKNPKVSIERRRLPRSRSFEYRMVRKEGK